MQSSLTRYGRNTERGDSWRNDVEDKGTAVAILAESDTILYLAGYMAATRFRDGHAKLPSAARLTSDLVGAHDSASSTWDGDIDELHHIYACAERTRTFLERPGVWLAVARTVAALLRCGLLSGDEVEAIVEEAEVEPPRWRLPLFCESDGDDEDFGWCDW